MNNYFPGKSVLQILYYTATSESEEDSLIFQYMSKNQEDGIPIGKLFFWIKGIWEYREGRVWNQ